MLRLDWEVTQINLILLITSELAQHAWYQSEMLWRSSTLRREWEQQRKQDGQHDHQATQTSAVA